MNICQIHLVDHVPAIQSVSLIDDTFTGAKTTSITELFSTRLIQKIHSEVQSKYWPFYLKHLLPEEEHDEIFPLLVRMTRKGAKQTRRSEILPLCEIMTKVHPKFQGQFFPTKSRSISFDHKLII